LKIIINDEVYVLNYESINVEKAAQIDYKSFTEKGYSSFFEMRNMLDCVEFELLKDDKVFYSSNNPNQNLEFNLVKKIYDAIHDSFSMNKEEIESFLAECKLFLENKNSDMKMPYELLLARNIYNGLLKMSLSDFENMEIKKYEKIQLALNLIEKKVEDTEIE
jgi:hypothetical protein